MKNSNQLNERLTKLEERVGILEQKLEGMTLPEDRIEPIKKLKPLSEKEFLLEKNPEDDVQKTFYLGSYLEDYKKVDSFTAEDLKNAFRSAREPVPSNINDKINKNVSKGLFMEVDSKDGKKAWVLTATGEKLAKDNLNNK